MTLVSGSFASHFAPATTGATLNITAAPYNAVSGNSSFDNKVAIQDAIDDAVAGDEVLIPAGTFYLLTGGLTLKTGVNIRGASMSTAILKVRSASTIATLIAAPQGRTDIRLTDFTIVRDTALAGALQHPLRIGNGSGSSGSYTACERIYIARVDVSGYQKYGVLFENVKHGFVWDSDFYLPTALGGNGEGYGINLSGPKTEECWIIGNRIGRTGEFMRHGVLVQYTAHNNLAEENICTGFVNDAFDTHGEEEHHNEFRLNEAYEPVRAHVSCGGGVCYPAAFGVGEYGAVGGTDHDNSGPYNWVHHNISVGDWRAGIRVNGGPDNPTVNTIIENNNFSGGDYGIQLGDIGTPNGAHFTQVKFNTVSGNAVGIHVVNADDATITSNHAHDNTTNLLVTTAANRYTIADNCFRRGLVNRQGTDGTYTGNAEGNVIDPPNLPPPDPFPGLRLSGGIQYIG